MRKQRSSQRTGLQEENWFRQEILTNINLSYLVRTVLHHQKNERLNISTCPTPNEVRFYQPRLSVHSSLTSVLPSVRKSTRRDETTTEADTTALLAHLSTSRASRITREDRASEALAPLPRPMLASNLSSRLEIGRPRYRSR